MDERRLALHAARHHGVFDRRLLDALGIDPRQARRMVASGRWRRLHENVYAAAATPDDFDLRAEAVLTAAPDGALGLRTAALIHGWRDDIAVDLDLCMEPSRTARFAGVVVHRGPLPRHHVTRRRGWRIATVERTLIDLAKVESDAVLQDTIEDAVSRRQTTMARIETTFAELATPGRTGIARARRVLARLDPVSPPESRLESAFIRLVAREGLPRPTAQARFEWLGAGRGRVDFWYEQQGLVVELDGRRFHDRSAQFEADRKRDQLGLLAGVRTVRITHRQLATERAHVVRLLRSLLL